MLSLLVVRFEQCGFWHGLNAKTVKVDRIKVRCSLYVSWSESVRELIKLINMNLVTANELDGMPVTLIAVDILLKFIYVYKRHNLRKNCFFLYSLFAE